MIGCGWVVLTGGWIQTAGSAGAMLAFLIGGIAVVLIGLTYAELASAMPLTGGEHVYSHRALGMGGSFFCTWAIILGYISVVAFEAVALRTGLSD
jgi:amino acid transporter